MNNSSGPSEGVPADADIILKEFIAGILKIKPDFVTGIYLTGSIPLNDFHPNKSDIDFLVLCSELPRNDLRKQIEQVHHTIKRKFKRSNLSGSYITFANLNIHQCETKVLSFYEGRLGETAFEMAPVTLYELRTVAITLLGIPLQDLPIVVAQKDVDDFMLKNINSYWRNWVTKHSSFNQRGVLLILFPRLTEWLILGVARQLYTLRTGKIASKTEVGFYCLEHLPHNYHYIIQNAISIRNDKRNHFFSLKNSYYLRPSVKRFVETIQCARYIIELFNTEYKGKTVGRLDM